jgi:isoleucyl-tRNA synthetase
MKQYKDTLNLPKTNFAMQANLIAMENQMLEHWKKLNIYNLIKNKRKNCNKFDLCFGPPYANGDLHMGHALNIFLKSLVLNIYNVTNHDISNITGHDCHGLPIELTVLKKNTQKKNLEDFRQECGEFADNFIDIQQNTMNKLAILKDSNYYATKNHVKDIYKVFSNILLKKSVYLDKKPVAWSTAEKTVIADVDITYKTKKSTSVDVALQIMDSPVKNLIGYYVVIWTTTPWTLIDNVAVAYNKDITYVFAEIENDKVLILAKDLVKEFEERTSIELNILGETPGILLFGSTCIHPLLNKEVPLLHGDHVTSTDGTGFVHTAPAHGLEDFALCHTYKIALVESVDEKGCYYENIPLLGGKNINDIDAIINCLHGKCLKVSTIEHEYPYSTRTDTPIIYRASEQIFIDLNSINYEAMFKNLNENVITRPINLKESFMDVLSKRKEWCVSRQRTWGVPLALFINKKTREILIDAQLQEIILKKMEKDSNYFLNSNCIDILEKLYNKEEYEPYIGVIEVWFDSGCVSFFVPSSDNANHEFKTFDVFVEGKDQIRGWFQSSLLTSYLHSEILPYKSIISHGFLVDAHGRKMSKSLGNGVNLEDVLKKYGVDILRLWIANSDYTNDVSFSYAILDKITEIYRKIRNVLRYMISIVETFSQKNKNILEFKDFEPLEKAILMEFKKICKNYNEVINRQSRDYMNIKKLFDSIYLFICRISGIYFNARKDTLYCDSYESKALKSTVSCFAILLQSLTIMLSPFIMSTAEEVFIYIKPLLNLSYTSILEYSIEDVKEILSSFNFSQSIEEAEDLLHKIHEQIDVLKQQNQITRNSDLEITVKKSPIDLDLFNLLLGTLWVKEDANLQESFQLNISSAVACERCWKRLGSLCDRCKNYIANLSD